MKKLHKAKRFSTVIVVGTAVLFNANSFASDSGWSVVPYVGASVLRDQSGAIAGATGISDGNFELDVETGFTAGISARFDYRDTPWISEFGWEYRSNDSVATASDGELFNDGNYASNTFYLNGRYAISRNQKLTPWVGGGLIYTQEIDLDSNNSDGGNSYSDSGSVDLQLLAGMDYDLSERFYLTSEIRWSSQSGVELESESGNGRVSGVGYQPLTLGIGLGIRF